MYSNSGYRDLQKPSLGTSDIPLKINCCGVYRLVSIPSIRTTRPAGLPDYQILYIASGRAWFLLEGTNTEVPAGHMVLYRPEQPQDYYYLLQDKPEVFWVHVTGYEVEKLAAEAGFSGGAVLETGLIPGCREYFLAIIRELQLFQTYSDEMAALIFRQLLFYIQRQRMTGGLPYRETQKEMEEAVHFFHENYSNNISISDYAKKLHMSTCWFIRCFKQYRGETPGQYLTSVRITRARDLLESTNCSVSEIGDIVGYENPLYFSRIFKRQTGTSPTEYRKLMRH